MRRLFVLASALAILVFSAPGCDSGGSTKSAEEAAKITAPPPPGKPPLPGKPPRAPHL